jgi:uroporphyrinogen-III synthase
LETDPDYIIFASASGVERYFSQHERPSPKTRCVSIGDVTAAALERQSVENILIAQEATADGIVQTILADRQS